MNFTKPLSGGLLIIGSLLWDEHETRMHLRNDTLNIDKAKSVSAPIRYGRKSDKRQTITMVLSTTCKQGNKMGKGILIPFLNMINSTESLSQVANKIIVAEHKDEISFTRFNWGWGCLAFLPNPNKLGNQNILQLRTFWGNKFSSGFEPLEYAIEGEVSIITKEGELLIDWKEEYGDLDFILLTATKPNISLLTAKQLSEFIKKNDSYFIGNRNNNIHTFQDEEIIKILNA